MHCTKIHKYFAWRKRGVCTYMHASAAARFRSLAKHVGLVCSCGCLDVVACLGVVVRGRKYRVEPPASVGVEGSDGMDILTQAQGGAFASEGPSLPSGDVLAGIFSRSLASHVPSCAERPTWLEVPCEAPGGLLFFVFFSLLLVAVSQVSRSVSQSWICFPLPTIVLSSYILRVVVLVALEFSGDDDVLTHR